MRDTKINIALVILGGIVLFLAGYGLGRRLSGLPVPAGVMRYTVTDTVRMEAPMVAAERRGGVKSYRVPASLVHELGSAQRLSADSILQADSCCIGRQEVQGDSVSIELELVQRYYSGDSYEAWVSGPIDPRLDSISVISRREVITERMKQRRWHLGVSGGYGLGPKGWGPFIGVGITYSLMSF